jgi:hypothetical protein
MKHVEQITFLQEGRKEVIRFIAVPVRFESEQEAIKALHETVKNYQLTCNKGYNVYYAPDNPFVAIIIHGIND